MTEWTLRPYEDDDLDAVLALFYETVHRVNRRDYSSEQCAAWAPDAVDRGAWAQSLAAHDTLVAETADGQLVGFADLDAAKGYLDRLYVHADYQGCGIATALCEALEPLARGEVITTHASLTARDFFAARGYRVVREQRVRRRGVALKNIVMEKNIQ